jgi:hypothetical protein
VGSQWGHSGVTVGSQWGYSGVTVGLQWGYSGVTVGLQWYHNGVAVGLQWERWHYTRRKRLTSDHGQQTKNRINSSQTAASGQEIKSQPEGI